MPISECDGCHPSHWSDVLKIIQKTASDAGLTARLVSETMESNLIHKEILSNIYNDDIVIVDVSGRNPNVFFELGIRMATQKPIVIVKDDRTLYPFDTGPNRLIEYPRDLRHPQMEIFKTQLMESLKKSIAHGPENSFIGQLGPFQIPKIEEKEVSLNDAVLSKLESIERRLHSTNSQDLRRSSHESVEISLSTKDISVSLRPNGGARMLCKNMGIEQIKAGIDDFRQDRQFETVKTTIRRMASEGYIIEIEGLPVNSSEALRCLASSIDNAIPF